MTTIKQRAIKIIKSLPDEINWDDLIYEFNLMKSIARGLTDVKEGNTISFEESRRRHLGK